MPTRARWMAVLAVVVVTILVAVFLWRGFRPAPAPPEIPNFTQDKVTATSPELAVSEALVRGIVHPGYIDWVCLIECLEPEGCRADLRVVVDFRSHGKPQRLMIDGRVDADMGETMRIGRVQRPPVEVDGVDKVTVEVRRSNRGSSPEPTVRK
jgi:hypothetical protein